ncbi:MAG TPA: hypothetical protein VF665_24100 [Longimicrobium sp.]|jgi:hypothetical protein|uniref:hypothetical protein n=1 Tax=Longimicrobium sp. TaxID=2029185 RepID=UPI002EDBB537
MDADGRVDVNIWQVRFLITDRGLDAIKTLLASSERVVLPPRARADGAHRKVDNRTKKCPSASRGRAL